jgi:hypothetical protein
LSNGTNRQEKAAEVVAEMKKGTGYAMNTKIKTEERIARLILAMGEGDHSRRELIAALGLRQESRRNFYTNYLHPAKARGLVCMTNPQIPSLPEQAYRLTADGLDFLAQLRQELSKKEQA